MERNSVFAESADIFKTLPATLMVTLGGFITNAVYCFYHKYVGRRSPQLFSAELMNSSQKAQVPELLSEKQTQSY